MEAHLGYNTGNSRNGYNRKALKGDHGEIEIATPRDRNGKFEPIFVAKNQTRLTKFDDQILMLYAKGMTTRDIVETFAELYGADISPALVSQVTDSVLEKILEWQSRPLDAVYLILYLDCIVVKKAVAADLKRIYQSVTVDEAELELEAFAEKWDAQYPSISASWRKHWANLIAFFDYPDEVRFSVYTTNAIESLNSVIRKAVERRKLFPDNDSALKVVYLAINQAAKKWTMPIQNWKLALNQFMILYGERLTGVL